MKMKSPSLKAAALATLVAGGLLFAGRLPAGEALVFSGTQNRPDPNLLLKKAKDKEAAGSKLAPVNPAVLVTPGQATLPRDKGLDRRARNARLEEKNWVDYDKGELNARDEEKNSLGLLEAGTGNRAEDEDPASRPTRPGQPRLNSKLSSLPSSRLEARNSPGTARRTPEGPKDPEAAKGSERDAKPSSTASGSAASSQGGIGDLNLRSLLAPGKANSLAPIDRSQVTWHDIFGSSPSGRSADTAPREDSVAVENGRGLAPAGSLTPASAGTDPLRFRSDFASRPGSLAPAGLPATPEPSLNPISPARGSLTSLTPPSAPKAPVTDFSRPQGLGPSTLGRQDNLNPLTPPTPAYPAYQAPAAQPPSGSTFNTLPTRPGFGR